MVFLQKREDKVAYLKGMVLLAKADGRIEKSEVEYINAAVVGMGLDEPEKKEIDVMWNDEGECLIEFSDKANAAFFVQEALQLAYIDGNYDEKERIMIYSLGERIGLVKDEVKRIEAWAEEGVQWKKRGEILIEEIAGE